VEIKLWRELGEERKIGLIGRFASAIFFVATLAFGSLIAAAAPVSVTDLTWHHNGVLTWEGVEHHAIAPPTIRRFSISVAAGRSKVTSHGSAGVLELRVRYAQRSGGPVHRSVLASAVTVVPKPRVVVEGVGGTPLANFAARGIAQMVSMAHDAIQMIATAYSADCGAGCDGMTAIGRRAGFGIVAVDPRVIPIGTHLYIPGYGFAVAGDTGGDIVGNRIDLGFDTLQDAMRFGRQDVKVYRLR
jgi:3D (Asp-Asp-Asp) domain-containing protein